MYWSYVLGALALVNPDLVSLVPSQVYCEKVPSDPPTPTSLHWPENPSKRRVLASLLPQPSQEGGQISARSQ